MTARKGACADISCKCGAGGGAHIIGNAVLTWERYLLNLLAFTRI